MPDNSLPLLRNRLPEREAQRNPLKSEWLLRTLHRHHIGSVGASVDCLANTPDTELKSCTPDGASPRWVRSCSRPQSRRGKRTGLASEWLALRARPPHPLSRLSPPVCALTGDRHASHRRSIRPRHPTNHTRRQAAPQSITLRPDRKRARCPSRSRTQRLNHKSTTHEHLPPLRHHFVTSGDYKWAALKGACKGTQQ
jgi:hypothetical protein